MKYRDPSLILKELLSKKHGLSMAGSKLIEHQSATPKSTDRVNSELLNLLARKEGYVSGDQGGERCVNKF